MGSYKSTFLGIFLSIKGKKVSVKKYKTIYISTSGKIQKDACKFDGEDGSPVEKKKEEYFVNETITNWYEIRNKFEDSEPILKTIREDLFFQPAAVASYKGFETWLVQDKVFSKGIEEIGFDDISEINPEEVIKRFEESYKDLLEFLRRNLEEVDVCYGVVNYAH